MKRRVFGPAIGTELPASLTAPRQARAFVRHVLTTWGLAAQSDDIEILASEFVANAAEHARPPIRLALRPYVEIGGQRGILCEVSDASPEMARPAALKPDAERGRGLRIVSALADRSGIETGTRGKTAWFMLAVASPERESVARQAGFEAEASAG